MKYAGCATNGQPLTWNGRGEGEREWPTVHLHQQLVQGVLLLALTAKVAPPPLPAHRVDLVDEEDARRVLPRQDKQISDLHGHTHTYI